MRWDGPCGATVFNATRRGEAGDAIVDLIENVDEAFTLTPGRYQVRLECRTTEGDYRQTLALRVAGRRLQRSVRLRPGFAVVEVERDGEPVSAELTFIDSTGRRVQIGRDKVALPLPPGELTVVARLDKKRSGRPIIGSRRIRVRARKKSGGVVDASDGTLTVKVQHNGKLADAVVTLRAPGTADPLAELHANEPSPAPPGEYEVVTQLRESHDFTEVVTNRVKISANRSKTIHSRHTTGTLLPTVVLDGKRVVDGIEIDVYLGQAPQPFNTVSAGEELVLSPGRYRLVARRSNQKLDDGSAWEADANARVTRKRRSTTKIDLTPARWTLRVNGTGLHHDLRLRLRRADAEAPFLRQPVPKDGRVGLTLPAGKYVALLSPEKGKHVLTKVPLVLRAHKASTSKVAFPVGRAAVQLLSGDMAVAADVRFFRTGRSKALVDVRAGQEVLLSPGSYQAVVERDAVWLETQPFEVTDGERARVRFEVEDLASRQQPPPIEDDVDVQSMPDGSE